MAVEPDAEQFAAVAAVAGGDRGGPVVIVKLNPNREAYMRYGEVASAVLERVGGRILWYTEAKSTVIGDDSDSYDEVIAVWYPNLAAFTALATAPEVLEAREHRLAGLERAALICCEPGAYPGVLSSELQR
jgi:uncharacterized protein (DUF1330 family)